MHFMTRKPSLDKENCPYMTSRVQHPCILWKGNLHQVKNSAYMTPRIQYTCILWQENPTRQRKLSLHDILDPTYMQFIERKPPPSEKQSLHDIKVSICKYFMERNPHQVETNCPYMTSMCCVGSPHSVEHLQTPWLATYMQAQISVTKYSYSSIPAQTQKIQTSLLPYQHVLIFNNKLSIYYVHVHD